LSFHVCTTMNRAGWEQHGRRMAQSFMDRWPDEAKPLTVYAEGFEPDVEGLDVRQLPDWLEPFKARHKGTPRLNGKTAPGHYDFRFDLVKFSHKVAAMTDFGLSVDDGTMIWLDADTFFHSDVTCKFLTERFPEPAYIAWLERQGGFPETGFVMFRAAHPAHCKFMTTLRDLYVTDSVLKQAEMHDAFLIWEIGKAMVRKGEIPAVVNLSGEAWRASHPAIVGPLGSILDHMKGPRKDEGKSRKRDLIRPRSEPYWQDVR
jgi:hypothetical protein